MKRPASRFAIALLGLVLGFPAFADELTVSAAASLTHAFRELAPLFGAGNPGTTLQFNFGASGALLQQLAQGAPVDVLATADQDTMDQAQSQGLVAGPERKNFASNTLVVIVPVGSSPALRALPDLANPDFRKIAIGLPASVPVGRYSKAALEKAGLWALIEPRMIGAQNVRQALDYVARGEVDAGFVYATDARLMPARVEVKLTVPTDIPILYPAAPVAGSPHHEAALRFVAFLCSPQAQAVLARYGFGKP